MGDIEARAELGMPEAIKGNLNSQQPAQPEEPKQPEERQFESSGEPQKVHSKASLLSKSTFLD